MPLTCPRCHAQNADGMAFCQQCGTPLSGETAPPATPVPPAAPPPVAPTPAAPPPAAPTPPIAPVSPAAPPPMAGPIVYQSVLPPQPPHHRLPGASIVGVLVGVLGAVTAIGIMFGHHSPIVVPIVPTNTPAAVASPTLAALPTQAQPTSQPQATDTTAPLPTNAPAATDTTAPLPTEAPPTETSAPQLPTQAPQPNPQPVQLGPALTTQYFTVQAPSNWSVQQQNSEVLLGDPHVAPDAIDIVGTAAPNGQTDLQTVLNTLLQTLQARSPDAAQCGQTQQASFGGKQGTIVPICFTFTPQGGSAISAIALAWASVSSDGSTVYVLETMSAKSQIQALLTDAAPVFHTLQWIGA